MTGNVEGPMKEGFSGNETGTLHSSRTEFSLCTLTLGEDVRQVPDQVPEGCTNLPWSDRGEILVGW